MNTYLTIEEIQRLCGEVKKKKRPSGEADAQTLWDYYEELHYTKLLNQENLQKQYDKLFRTAESKGSEEKLAYQPRLELIKRAIDLVNAGGIEVDAAERQEYLRDITDMQLLMLRGQYKELSDRELILKLDEKYFHILRPGEILKTCGGQKEQGNLFPRAFIDSVLTITGKQEALYMETIQAIEQESGTGVAVTGGWNRFLNTFAAYRETERGKRRLNQDNTDELLNDVEKGILNPIREADADAKLQHAMILAMRYPDCMTVLCATRDLEHMEESVIYEPEQAKILVSRMQQRSKYGLNARMIYEIAPYLNIELQRGASQGAGGSGTATGQELSVAMEYLTKALPQYIEQASYYDKVLKELPKPEHSRTIQRDIEKLNSVITNLPPILEKWEQHRRILDQMDFGNYQEIYQQIENGDVTREQIFGNYQRITSDYRKKYDAIVHEKESVISEFRRRTEEQTQSLELMVDKLNKPFKYHTKMKEQKQIAKQLKEIGPKLKQLRMDMISVSMVWQTENDYGKSKANELEEIEEWLAQVIAVIEQVPKNARRRRWNYRLFLSLACFGVLINLIFGIDHLRTEILTNRCMPTTQELQAYNDLMKNLDAEKLAPYLDERIAPSELSDLKLLDGSYSDVSVSKAVIRKYVNRSIDKNEKIQRTIQYTYTTPIMIEVRETAIDFYAWLTMYRGGNLENKKNPDSSQIKRNMDYASILLKGKGTKIVRQSDDGKVVSRVADLRNKVFVGTYEEEMVNSSGEKVKTEYPIKLVIGDASSQDGQRYDDAYFVLEDGSEVPCSSIETGFGEDSWSELGVRTRLEGFINIKLSPDVDQMLYSVQWNSDGIRCSLVPENLSLTGFNRGDSENGEATYWLRLELEDNGE